MREQGSVVREGGGRGEWTAILLPSRPPTQERKKTRLTAKNYRPRQVEAREEFEFAAGVLEHDMQCREEYEC